MNVRGLGRLFAPLARDGLSRGVSALLLVVVVAMAAFSWTELRADRARIAEVERAQALGDAYTHAHIEILEVEKNVLQFEATLAPEAMTRVLEHGAVFAAALVLASELGGAGDRAFVEALFRYADPFAAVYMDLAVAGDNAATRLVELNPQLALAYSGLVAGIRSGELGDPALADRMDNPLGPGAVDFTVTRNPIPLILGPRALAHREEAAMLTAQSAASIERRLRLGGLLYGSAALLVVTLLVAAIWLARRDAASREHISQLRLAVTTDPLTGLGNRRGYEEQLNEFMAASPSDAGTALLVFDLDEFKSVNDTFGHDRGDSILRAFGAVMVESAGAESRSFRIGGDEFAVTLAGRSPAEAFAVAETIRREVQPRLGNNVTVSAGVATTVDRDSSLLRQQADSALYEAKLRGRNMSVLYADDGRSAPLFPAAKLAAVRALLDEGRVEPVFQPMWNLYTGELIAYEGLSRPHPDYGLSGPQQAFDIAERFGRAADLDRICRQHILEAATGLPPDIRLFVNLSPYTLTHRGFDPLAIRREVVAAGLKPARIVFEITERSLVSPDAIAEGVMKLRQCGFRVALDDVGAGNNGLEMLRKVPFEFVKIDREVILSAQSSGTGRASLMAILAFASEAGAFVVAEGVEDEAMLGVVHQFAESAVRGVPGLIHGVQGYLLGLPAPAGLTVPERSLWVSPAALPFAPLSKGDAA